MTLAEVGQALDGRLRRPSLWAVFTLAVAVYSVFPIVLWFQIVPRPDFLREVGPNFLGTLAYFFTFVWLSPVAWEWDGKHGNAPAPKSRWWAGFLGAELLALLLVLLQHALSRIQTHPDIDWLTYLGGLCLHGPGLFLVGNLLSGRERMEQEREELRHRTEAVMAEHLKGQMHPHVLFNTLNGLAELMQYDHEAAEELVEAMSGFLHRILEASQTSTWPLLEERILAEDYLRMEATRLGERLKIVWNWEPGQDEIQILPLLIQPLLENAVKHGINPSPSGGEIQLNQRIEGPELILEVLNSTAGLSAQSIQRKGVGLANLKRRLDLAYGSQARLQLEQEASGWTRASVRINLTAKPRL